MKVFQLDCKAPNTLSPQQYSFMFFTLGWHLWEISGFLGRDAAPKLRCVHSNQDRADFGNL